MCCRRLRCRDCRDRSAVGRAFRSKLAARFEAPSGAPVDHPHDFLCPHGVVWSIPVSVVSPSVHREQIPTWDQLEERVTQVWPAWLPEFLESRRNFDRKDCKICESNARRRRWQERIAEIPLK